jgi:enterobactin synthetase component D / holo-[acyl-carrier protein] synthase
VIGEILPAGVAYADTADRAAGSPLSPNLFPEEERLVARAGAKRRRDYTGGRACARAALARLGCAPEPVLSGPRGAPVWPPGVVGSITHCAGYQACAAARSADFVGVGVDAEPNEPLPDDVLDAVAAPGEQAGLAALAAANPAVCWDRLLFSAKEAVYKVWYPLTGRWLGFADAVLAVDAHGGFTVRLLVPGPVVGGRPLSRLAGRWTVRNGVLATAVVLPAQLGAYRYTGAR